MCSNNASLKGSCAYTNNGTAEPPPCCECGAGLASSRCVWDVSAWNRDLAPLAPLARNSSATPQFMGSIPGLKNPGAGRIGYPPSEKGTSSFFLLKRGVQILHISNRTQTPPF